MEPASQVVEAASKPLPCTKNTQSGGPSQSVRTPDFPFVNISKPNESQGHQNRSLVRSLVAQNRRKKQLLSHSEQGPHSCFDPSIGSLLPALNFCPVCGYALAKNRRSSKPFDPSSIPTAASPKPKLSGSSALGAGRVDPFGAFPIHAKPYMHILVDHCKLFVSRREANYISLRPLYDALLLVLSELCHAFAA